MSELIGDHVRLFQRGEIWYANYQFGNQQIRRSLRTRSKKVARRKAVKLEAEILEGDSRNVRQPPSICQVIEKYRDHLQVLGRASTTLAKYEYAFKRMLELAERRNARSILDINLDFVDAYRAERVRGGAAAKTVHTDSVVIRQIVNFALQRGMIGRDPLKGIRLKKPKTSPQPWWTKQQIDRILGASDKPQQDVFRVLAETGMRIGELKHLTWQDVDFDEGFLYVRPKDGWRPKTGDQRAIPMTPAVRDVLSQRPRDALWVFTAPRSRQYPDGKHFVSERRLLAYLKCVLKQLELPGHLHTFRHSFISHALTSGVPEAIVQQWVGHVDREVLKLYTHIADSASRDAMRRLAGSGETRPGSAQIQH